MADRRLCTIESASIEDENGAGDGAYDLLDVAGTPEEVGRFIGDSLRETELVSGRDLRSGRSPIADGNVQYLILRIAIRRAPTPETDDNHHTVPHHVQDDSVSIPVPQR